MVCVGQERLEGGGWHSQTKHSDPAIRTERLHFSRHRMSMSRRITPRYICCVITPHPLASTAGWAVPAAQPPPPGPAAHAARTGASAPGWHAARHAPAPAQTQQQQAEQSSDWSCLQEWRQQWGSCKNLRYGYLCGEKTAAAGTQPRCEPTCLKQVHRHVTLGPKLLHAAAAARCCRCTQLLPSWYCTQPLLRAATAAAYSPLVL